MLETYFVKPQTVDRVRACWIGAEIERYAGWLSEQGYSTRTVQHQVPALVAFGEFARLRGASAPADLPVYVDGFVAMRVAGSGRGRDAATEVRGPVEQMLAVVLPGFERAGRVHVAADGGLEHAGRPVAWRGIAPGPTCTRTQRATSSSLPNTTRPSTTR
jgi:integrase/recombinase XerD